MPTIYLSAPFGQKPDADGRMVDFDAVHAALKASITSHFPIVQVVRRNDTEFADELGALRAIREADAVIVDIATLSSNCLYELGLAHGLEKPAIIITARSAPIPFDFVSYQILHYDPNDISTPFLSSLGQMIATALDDPGKLSPERLPARKPKSAFISYSHRDVAVLDRLLVHLRPLERAGLLDTWVDTRIRAGDDWKRSIEVALERAAVAVVLVSADFLASDFVVNNELPPLLAKAEVGGTRVLPVIVKPCRFARDSHLSRFQAVNPPERPLTAMAEHEREEVFDRLAAALEQLLAA